MADREHLEGIVRSHGLADFAWIDPQSIVVSQWVRMKCQYGCPNYGRVASCPPNTPSVDESRRFFAEYQTVLMLHFQKVAAERELRRGWSAKVNAGLAKLERDVFLAGCPKAFMLFMDSCHICAQCVPDRSQCKEPILSRPSPEGMAVDVFATVKQVGYPIQVLTDPSQEMNRYALLMVE